MQKKFDAPGFRFCSYARHAADVYVHVMYMWALAELSQVLILRQLQDDFQLDMSVCTHHKEVDICLGHRGVDHAAALGIST